MDCFFQIPKKIDPIFEWILKYINERTLTRNISFYKNIEERIANNDADPEFLQNLYLMKKLIEDEYKMQAMQSKRNNV